ncbi:hypothetical protein [Salana multivorans]|uniref:hypothetical protein n=1 Tax=Salana multivorans TaxID=120377 RepID=UPI002492C110|nr:hypothetical protein [Salana multivorans]
MTLLCGLLVGVAGCTAPRDDRTRAEIETDVQARVAEVAAFFGELVEDRATNWYECDPAWDQSGERYYYTATVQTEYALYEDFIDELWPGLEGDGWTLDQDEIDPKDIGLRRPGVGVRVRFIDPAQERDVVFVSTGVGCVRPADY